MKRIRVFIVPAMSSSLLLAFLLAGCRKPADQVKPPAASRPSTASAPAIAGKPRLSLDREFIDLGAMKPQETRQEKVLISNKGAADLAISKALVTCRCFTVAFDKMTIPPGQSAELTVKIMSLDYQGQNRETIGIASNDPAGPHVLTVRFEVPGDLATDPERLYLGIVRPQEVVKRQVKVLANVQADTKVLYTVSDTTGLVGRVVDGALTTSKPAVVEVEFKAPAEPGTYRHDLTITTAYPARPTVSLPVVLCVSKSVTVAPDRLDFGRFPRGQTVERTLNAQTTQGATELRAAARPDVLDVAVGKPDDQGRLAIQVKPKPGAPYGPMAGEIWLQEPGSQAATLVVPFAGYVAEGKGT